MLIATDSREKKRKKDQVLSAYPGHMHVRVLWVCSGVLGHLTVSAQLYNRVSMCSNARTDVHII